jgi:CubicO group peptidase (beta-lactamase class C family)
MRFPLHTALFVLMPCGVALAEPDEAVLGKADGYPRGTAATMYAERFKVGSFSAADQITPSHPVARGEGEVTPLPRAGKGTEATIVYRFKGERRTLDDYLERERATGLLVLKDGAIVAERYRYGRTEQDRFLSFSMAKTVTSLLIGIATEKGFIKSLDDPAESFVPELKGSGYGQATVRQLLRMSSGVKWVENYDGKDDIARLGRAMRGLIPGGPLGVLASYNERAFPAGEKLGYSSSESMVLGYVLTRAVGKDIATLTSEWLWKPLGAEADAAWRISVDGQEETLGGFNATLRDYGRLGLLLAHDGQIAGRRIVPKEYVLDATSADRQPPAFRPRTGTPYYGYGYQTWLFPMRERMFAMLGIYGQCLFVQPATGIVMVQTAVNKDPKDAEANAERDALWRGVLASLGGRLDP